MKYSIVISRQAAKEIKKLPKLEIPKIYAKISTLSQDPRPTGVVKLVNFENMWRVRVGNYRILYSIEDELKVLDIRRVANRKDAY